MKSTTDSHSRSPPQAGGLIIHGTGGDAAQPSLTSGFGAVLDKEHDLQRLTEASLGHMAGRRANAIDRILRFQHARLGANIALLEQRYESLPKPERFGSWQERHHPLFDTGPTAPGEEGGILFDLVARHTNLFADIDALVLCAPDGRRGELILTEVARNHEEMAWMLTALLEEDATAARPPSAAGDPSVGDTSQAQERWDNEGGLARRAPPAG